MSASFFQRPYPSANAVLLHGPAPVLVDTGFGADIDGLLDWLRAEGIAPERLVAKGYGAWRPVNDNRTLEQRASNRRVQFRRLDR